MISAYCWPQSAHQRESITLYCHTNAATYQYEVIRQGAVDEPVLRRSGVRGQSQLMSQNLAATGCHWQPSLNIAIDPNWPSGFYLIRLEAFLFSIGACNCFLKVFSLF